MGAIRRKEPTVVIHKGAGFFESDDGAVLEDHPPAIIRPRDRSPTRLLVLLLGSDH